MFKNITNWQTTIPTLAGIVSAILGLFQVIPEESIGEVNSILAGIGLSILTLVGLLAKHK